MTKPKKKPQGTPVAATGEALPEPLASVEAAPEVDLKVDQKTGKDRLEELLTDYLITKFTSKKGPSARDIATATTLLRTEARERIVAAAGSARVFGKRVHGGAEGEASSSRQVPPGAAAGGLEMPDATANAPAGDSVPHNGSWSPMETHERAAVDLPFLPFGEDGEPTMR